MKSQITTKQLVYHNKIESLEDDGLEIIARAAHDMCSPIAMLEIMSLSIKEKVSNEDYSQFKKIIKRIRDITNDYLISYREQTVLNFICLDNLVREVVSLKTYEWHDKSFEFIVSTSGVGHAYIYARSDEIERMLSNLLNNSFEACTSPAIIKISTCKIDKFIMLTIADNGAGMGADKITRYLNGESTKHQGRGLGLVSAKRYMKEIGGDLQIKSCPGVGTEIILKFTAQ